MYGLVKGATRLSDESIKVTDKRMFTPDGELREEYRFLDEQAKARETAAAEAPKAPVDPPAEREAPPPAEPAPEPVPERAAARPEVDMPESEGEGPGFFDLLGVLAEPVPFYLGDAALPTGEREENLEAARFYIDLLDTLRQKTAGNLTAQEADALEDVLYRLRVRYVQKRR
jgi:hypothetical protein